MWIGLFLGLVYTTLGFHAETQPPRLALTLGPIHQGMLFICGYHIHHWMVFLLVLPLAWILSWDNMGAFSLVMVAHGLTYTDAFVL
jgi:hypothetical protein